jgi:hypothetical protein
MLIPFTLVSGATAYISGDHVEEVSAHGVSGSAILLSDGTVVYVTQAPAVVVAAVNASFSTTLIANPAPAVAPAPEPPPGVPIRIGRAGRRVR